MIADSRTVVAVSPCSPERRPLTVAVLTLVTASAFQAMGVGTVRPRVARDLGWTVAGLGIGLGYTSLGALALAQAGSGEEGGISAALQLIETICIALFTGLGGALIAAGLHHGWDRDVAIALIFAAAATLAAVPGARCVD